MIKPRPAFWLAFAVSLLVPMAGFGQKKPKIIVVTHGQASDPFWLVVRNGVETAAKETGIDVEYQATGQFDLPAMSKLVDAAVASKPDGLVHRLICIWHMVAFKMGRRQGARRAHI
jgi:simple sugar transport system substrate-binding protein